MVYDSAIRATGGRYLWTYPGTKRTLPEALPHTAVAASA